MFVQACPSNEIDFRQQQCSSYDDADFQSVKYEWEPYIKGNVVLFLIRQHFIINTQNIYI